MAVDGLDKLNKRFRNLPRAAAKAIEPAVHKGALEVQTAARTLAPVDTGELRDAIEVKDDISDFKATGAIGNFGNASGGGVGDIKRYIGLFPEKRNSPGWYGAWVEFGTAPRSQKFGNNGTVNLPGTPPRPFLFPAYRLMRKRVVGRVRRAIKKAAKSNV